MDDLHVTLRFFGDVTRSVAHDLIDSLAAIDVPMFAIRLNGLGTFGSKEPHAIWISVEANPALIQLQAATERAARAAGLAPETRTFRPHVTIARLRRPPERALARYLGHKGGFRTEPFPVARFALFSSKPNVGGGPYVVDQLFPLQGGSWDDDEDWS